jgi:dTDP-N-acetylfucosamine:lipid II N-acetylfucosaminyltransferase
LATTKIKIAHIHSDFKFISETSHSYSSKEFENIIIILDKKNALNEKYHNSAIFIEPKNGNLPLILKICNVADLVVLYDLTTFKCKITLALPTYIKIAWRFFGYELYSRKLETVLSDSTKLLLETLPRERQFILKSLIGKMFFHKDIFLLSVKRIDYFFGMYEEEYKHLKSFWPSLPTFVSTLVLKGEVDYKFIEKKPYFIVGNNRSFYNNHSDIIQLIKRRKNANDYTAKFFFNYGNANTYSDAIRNSIKNCTGIELCEDFLPVEEFEDIYRKASAFVMNGYRQMALGNIFTALKYGVKVYLNKRNDTLIWLRNNNFIICTIEDFEKDLENGNLQLLEKEALHNISCFNKLKIENSPKIFQMRLKTLITKEPTI